jgi:hypothetical protein
VRAVTSKWPDLYTACGLRNRPGEAVAWCHRAAFDDFPEKDHE